MPVNQRNFGQLGVKIVSDLDFGVENFMDLGFGDELFGWPLGPHSAGFEKNEPLRVRNDEVDIMLGAKDRLAVLVLELLENLENF